MKKSIFNSLFGQGLQIILSFLTIKILVMRLGVDDYGTWATLKSLVAWIILFDFGLGYGLKNRISEEYAINRKLIKVSRLTVSVTIVYFIIAMIVSLLAIVAIFFVTPFSQHLYISFIFVIITSILLSLSSGRVILQGLGNFSTLYYLSLIFPFSWFCYNLIYINIPLELNTASLIFSILLGIQTIVIFYVSNKFAKINIFDYLNIKIFDLKGVKKILIPSFNFFVLQLISLFLFSSGNYIAYNLLGAKGAAIFDILNKIYQVFIVGFSVIISISWTEISKAKSLNDRIKTRNIYFYLILFSILVFIVSFLFIFIINSILLLFGSTELHVEISDAFWFSMFVFVQSLAYSGAVFLNAYEMLKIQIYIGIFSIIIFFSCIYFLHSINFGGVGIIPLSLSISILPSVIYSLVRGWRLAAYGK